MWIEFFEHIFDFENLVKISNFDMLLSFLVKKTLKLFAFNVLFQNVLVSKAIINIFNINAVM